MRSRIPLSLFGVLLAGLLCAACSSDSCTTVESEIGAICLPQAIVANQQAVLDVRESCGAICAQPPSCTAIVLSGAIYLTLREDQCSSTVQACIATQCNQNTAPCTIPALSPGDYPIVVSGGPAAVLHVRATGQSGCHLPVAPAAADAGVSDAGTGDAGTADAGT